MSLKIKIIIVLISLTSFAFAQKDYLNFYGKRYKLGSVEKLEIGRDLGKSEKTISNDKNATNDRFYDQLVDHFDKSLNKTWKQVIHYQFIDYKKTSLIIFNIKNKAVFSE